MVKSLQVGTLAVLLMIELLPAANAEYMIYLKGGHFIIADECAFSVSHRVGEPSEADTESTLEDCTREKKPKGGRIFWRTINGESGEVNVDDVYDVFGSGGALRITPPSSTMPLEDYLITNRGESFVNAKTVEQQDVQVYGVKRDELAEIHRRSVIEITPEHSAKSRSGEGLCPGEPVEFALGEIEIVGGRLLVDVRNLSKDPWKPKIEVEVRVKGQRVGKFQLGDASFLSPDGEGFIDNTVPDRFLKELDRLKDADAGVRLCYRKIREDREGSR
ncbi:hypothetical protein MELA_00758 [Candidatus Methylomirabilis lanthanidiphila]|uniref:Uncharacterized protein n=1 Tax=Candidatus Methylomirabilis lanthanidiphila TaxID=2211376 RepID=A0A564ZHJ6_9BACT|nr:hypothetical protein [Candidatus Methylomirabilis lanthanidiphila]VUZ84387.1 hypothetical protein MELA_00758 [Candidatus Methylomirabilis lanthanidiphila]